MQQLYDFEQCGMFLLLLWSMKAWLCSLNLYHCYTPHIYMKSSLMLCYLSSSTALLLLCMQPCLALQNQPRPRNRCLIFYATKAQSGHVVLDEDIPYIRCSASSIILDMQNQQPKDSPPPHFAIGQTWKNGAEAEGQQDELGDGLNLVNCGMYLDVNNANVSQSVIGSALVYFVFISVCSFRRNVVHCSKKAITCAPSSKAHSKIHEKHSKRVKAAIILIPNS